MHQKLSRDFIMMERLADVTEEGYLSLARHGKDKLCTPFGRLHFRSVNRAYLATLRSTHIPPGGWTSDTLETMSKIHAALDEHMPAHSPACDLQPADAPNSLQGGVVGASASRIWGRV